MMKRKTNSWHFPKKSMGIAELIYNKAAGPSQKLLNGEGKEKGVLQISSSIFSNVWMNSLIPTD